MITHGFHASPDTHRPPSALGYLRVNLGAADALIEEAAARIASYAFGLHEKKAAARPRELLPE